MDRGYLPYHSVRFATRAARQYYDRSTSRYTTNYFGLPQSNLGGRFNSHTSQSRIVKARYSSSSQPCQKGQIKIATVRNLRCLFITEEWTCKLSVLIVADCTAGFSYSVWKCPSDDVLKAKYNPIRVCIFDDRRREGVPGSGKSLQEWRDHQFIHVMQKGSIKQWVPPGSRLRMVWSSKPQVKETERYRRKNKSKSAPISRYIQNRSRLSECYRKLWLTMLQVDISTINACSGKTSMISSHFLLKIFRLQEKYQVLVVSALSKL